MKVLNLNESILINNINMVALNCFTRPPLITIDNVTKDQVYYYLLMELELQTGLLSQKIQKNIEDMEFYKLDRFEEDADNLYQIIKKMIDGERYMILCINFYYSKRHTYYYQKKHHWHYCLIKGYDDDTKEIIIIDEDPNLLNDFRTAFNPYYEQRIAVDEFKILCSSINELVVEKKKAYVNSFFYFELKLNMDKINSCKEDQVLELYRMMIEDLSEQSYQNEIKYINGIKSFEKKVDDSLYEFQSIYPYPKEIEFIFKHIDSLNMQYRVLELIMDKDIFENNLKVMYGKLITRFEIIKKLLIKFFYSKKNSIVDNIIEKYINKISYDEKKLYTNIIKQIEQGNICLQFDSMKFDELNNHEIKMSIDKRSEYQYIDLMDSLNSKCFVNNIDNIDNIDSMLLGDFIENGELICADSLVNEKFIELDDMKFMLPQIIPDKYDNISCCSNSVKISYNNSVDNIMLLGFSEWGNYTEDIIVKYRDYNDERISVSFNNLTFLPKHSEKIIWEGKKVHVNKKIYNKACLFGICRTPKINEPITEIILPDCPNMHILAITIVNKRKL